MITDFGRSRWQEWICVKLQLLMLHSRTQEGRLMVGTRRGLGGIVTLALTLLLASGCHKDQKDQAAAGGASPRQIKLAGIVFQEDQFFRLVLFGMRDAAKKAGAELLEGNSDNKPEEEIQLVNTYVVQNVDGILIAPVSAKGSVAALKLAHDKGIAVVTYNSSIDADFAAADVECSASDLGEESGKAAREYIEKSLGGKAKVAIIAYKSQVPEQSDARSGGFKSEITQLPGVQIVAEQDAWLPEMAVKTVGDILTAHPDVNIVWAANEGGTTGAALAVKNAGKAGQVAVFGTDCSQQLLDLLQSPDNILQAITAQRPVDEGRLAVESAIKAINHQPVDKSTILKGVLLTRTDPDAVKAFAQQFKQWTSEGQ
jgi:ABC-type sugar transport system substrate-binding protein